MAPVTPPHLFNRYELKYVIDLPRAAALRDDLADWTEVDTLGSPDGIYPLWNLYFDSPGLRFYWEKIDGQSYRRKVRIRHYGLPWQLAADTVVWVEVKQRIGRVTQKRRAPLPYRDALALCCNGTVPDHDERHRAVVEEIACLVYENGLVPTVVVGYRREALMGTGYDPGLRITFDRRLLGRARDLDLRIDGNTRTILPQHRVVLEVKIDEKAPRWLTLLLAKHNLWVGRLSKYCLAVEECAVDAHTLTHPTENLLDLLEETTP